MIPRGLERAYTGWTEARGAPPYGFGHFWYAEEREKPGPSGKGTDAPQRATHLLNASVPAIPARRLDEAFLTDTIEKVGSLDQWSNNRIRLSVSLNPYCPFGPAFESMLRRDPLKIFFQQHRPKSDVHLPLCTQQAHNLKMASTPDGDVLFATNYWSDRRNGSHCYAAWILPRVTLLVISAAATRGFIPPSVALRPPPPAQAGVSACSDNEHQFTGENFWTRLVSPTSPV
jgi:hypothetical protein